MILVSQEHRSVARFISYALCAADEALKDAKWVPTEQEQKERTVITYCSYKLMSSLVSFQ